VFKGILMGLGGLVVLGVVVGTLKALLFPMFVVGVLTGVGYLGFKMIGESKKAVSGAKQHKALADKPGDDFERKMRELEAIDRQLDAEIRKHSS
jgi:hypothetical protein